MIFKFLGPHVYLREHQHPQAASPRQHLPMAPGNCRNTCVGMRATRNVVRAPPRDQHARFGATCGCSNPRHQPSSSQCCCGTRSASNKPQKSRVRLCANVIHASSGQPPRARALAARVSRSPKLNCVLGARSARTRCAARTCCSAAASRVGRRRASSPAAPAVNSARAAAAAQLPRASRAPARVNHHASLPNVERGTRRCAPAAPPLASA